MKATTLLERQHRDLEQLCETVEGGSEAMRASLLPQLADDLAAHIAVEDQVFHPAACEALHDDAWLRASRSRHERALASLDRALCSPVAGDEFTLAIGEIRNAVASDAAEEEDLFRQLERTLDVGTMRELGEAMLSLYHSKLEAGYRA